MAATLNVTKALQNPGQEYPFSATAEIGDMEVLGDLVHFTGVTIEGHFAGIGESVSINAVVKATVHSNCCRCLCEMAQPLEAEMHALFVKQRDPEDPDQYGFEFSTVDLTDATKDALLLELPMRFLCSEECKGLCPVCGINLNSSCCTCLEGGDVSNPFSALKAIVENNEEV